MTERGWNKNEHDEHKPAKGRKQGREDSVITRSPSPGRGQSHSSGTIRETIRDYPSDGP